MKRALLALGALVLVLAGGFLLLRPPAAVAPPGAGAAGPIEAAGTAGARNSPDARTSPGTRGSPDAASAIEFAPGDLYTVGTGTVARTIPVTGTLTPVNRTTVKAKVAGEVLEMAVREGTAVREGQLIVRLDPTDFTLRLREREAQFRSAEAQVVQAQRTLENNRQLLEKHFISQNAFDNALSATEVAVAARDAAGAQLSQARKALADTRLFAPMAGIVAQRFVQIGEKVAVDGPVASLVDLSRMEIEAPVPASDIGAVRIGQPIALSIEGIAGEQTGRVVRINPGTQAGTRSIPIYIAVDFEDTRARAGMFAQGRLALEQRSGVLVVPVAAIRETGARQFVYLVEGDRLRERDVRLSLRDESARGAGGAVGLVEVLEGLKAGDRIVGVNLGALRAGSMVSVASGAAAPTVGSR
ncbi:MAG: efflux RND transporter periplasmic adaptor subunit [Burkholderiales bacterium]|nr:efflux RND transporter periplasmic adaptor subunit [Burkholderiales bacterium]